MTRWVLKTLYIRKMAFFVAAIAVLSGCSDNSTKEISGTDTKGQPWTITLAAQPETLRLPETQTMKLLGGDLSAYIKEKCEPLWLSERCDVYAQAEPTGALLGYLTVVKTGDNGFSYETDTLTSQNKACLLGGRLEDIQGDVNGDFSARSPFQYVGEGRDAGGMIYLKKRGRNLQLTDERWNYCYSNRHIDDIYVFVGSLVRSAPEQTVTKQRVSDSGSLPNTIPARYLGRWTEDASRCDTRYDDSKVEIYSDAMRFWESEGEVTKVVVTGDKITVQLSMFGEGQSWTSDLEIQKTSIPNKILLNGNPRYKCP